MGKKARIRSGTKPAKRFVKSTRCRRFKLFVSRSTREENIYTRRGSKEGEGKKTRRMSSGTRSRSLSIDVVYNPACVFPSRFLVSDSFSVLRVSDSAEWGDAMMCNNYCTGAYLGNKTVLLGQLRISLEIGLPMGEMKLFHVACKKDNT